MTTITLEQRRQIINFPEPGWPERACWVACPLPRLIEEEKKRKTPKRHYERTNCRGSTAEVGV
jgi:hypothetical protein